MDRDNRPLILIDATASLSGGAVYLRNLITHLRQNGEQFRLHLLRTSDFEIPVPEADRSAVTVEEIRLPSLATRYWLFGSLYKMLWRLIVLPWLIWSHRPAIFFSNSGSLPPLRPSSVRPVVAIQLTPISTRALGCRGLTTQKMATPAASSPGKTTFS